jgi:hypothetical protein
MAFIKNINSNFGIDAVYWKIAELNANFADESINVVLFGFSSKEARFAGSEPLIKTGVKIPNNNYFDRTSLYNLIKNFPEFDGAQDA